MVLPGLAAANPMMVVDVGSGRVIAHEEAFRKWYPASLTKLMTAYTTFRSMRSGELSPETVVVMSKHAADQPASKMYFRPGSKLTLDSALKLLIIKSANDVAVAIGETVSGSEAAFVQRMNQEAARLGMNSTRFVNPNGLPGKGQYTTARDMALLATTIRREFPEYAGYFALEGVTTGKKDYPNFNLLVGRFPGADGMKTGYVCASGFNQVSSATRNGRTVISVVLGADSLGARADLSADLLQKGLTTSVAGNRLDQLAPYGEGQDQVTDISAEICNPKARQIRSEGRDEAGRMKLTSPYIQEMGRPPAMSFAGLIPGSEPVATKQGSGTGEIANVPIPRPRPTF
ncbi:D-alanyl-D-alanine carboxypeptidase family protein [Rhizobium sp. RU33A]|uniref:D-alanyl-D-alanine carboxypeptidase family protein n=1 Tax=Rhizobium sp. RU33A TaxID=1907413 RepID=UPI001FCCE198|nr:D-alanyl-D-alanine carboxypeptidase family protein [Rhizobium sp. RU33A]